MLHIWLVPVLGLMAVAFAAFYLLIRVKGGDGIRTEGRTMHHKSLAEEDLPPGVN